MTEEINREGLTLSDYWQIFKKRKNIAILTFIVVVASVYFFTKTITPVYKASNTVELRYQSPHLAYLGGALPSMYRIINRDTEIRKMESFPIMEKAAKKLGYVKENSMNEQINQAVNRLRGKISANEVKETTLIQINAQDSNPDHAVSIANTVAQVYVEKTIEEQNQRAKNTREFIEDQLTKVGERLREQERKARKFKVAGKISGRIEDLGTKLSNLLVERSRLQTLYGEKHPKIVSLNNQISNLRSNVGNLTSDELEWLNLKREATINEELYMMLNKKLKEAQIGEADKVIPVSIVDPAKKASLIKPNKKINMLMGIIMGMALALIIVLLQENLDTSLRNAGDIETYLKVPTLTEIPHIKKKKSDSKVPLILSQQESSEYIEAFNTLAASLMSIGRDKKIQTILFMSMMPREGKSEVVSNFGIVESHSGSKTLLIDADFRQATLHRMFKLSRKPGIIDVITKDMDWKEVVKPALSNKEIEQEFDEKETKYLKNLYLLSVGHLPPHPMRFLSSKEFQNMMDKVKQEFDIILLDSPPLYYFADPTVLSNIVDGIIMVHRPGSIGRRELIRKTKQLRGKESKFLGVVLNDVKERRKKKYYYRYYSQQSKT